MLGVSSTTKTGNTNERATTIVCGRQNSATLINVWCLVVVLFRYYSIYYSGDFVLWKVVSQYYYVEVIMQYAFIVVYVEYFEVLVCSNGSPCSCSRTRHRH